MDGKVVDHESKTKETLRKMTELMGGDLVAARGAREILQSVLNFCQKRNNERMPMTTSNAQMDGKAMDYESVRAETVRKVTELLGGGAAAAQRVEEVLQKLENLHPDWNSNRMPVKTSRKQADILPIKRRET
jgi:hypothetical protein